MAAFDFDRRRLALRRELRIFPRIACQRRAPLSDARLAASFGRPVDVSWFDFSLLDGARIEAHFISVSDDPHFGNEYFLRSDTLTAGLRWPALLAGRFEFGPVSLARPSLNLARDAEGHWNIERWLPPAPQPGSRAGFYGPARAFERCPRLASLPD